MSGTRQEVQVRREFDRTAAGYDESRLVKSFQRRAQMLTISKMQIRNGMNILDLGCGTGQGTIDIASRLEGTGRVIGLDLSQKMIERARQKLVGFEYDNVEFEVGSGGSLDYNLCFDCVISTNAFHHFENKEDIFSRVRKSLKYYGVFIVQDICDDYFLMKMVDLAGKIGERAHVGSDTLEGLIKLFLTKGFKNILIDKIKLNWFWGIMIGMGTKPSGPNR
ncbi:class I SAM-dependent methyltransferase [Chloroflexota bacterium]